MSHAHSSKPPEVGTDGRGSRAAGATPPEPSCTGRAAVLRVLPGTQQPQLKPLLPKLSFPQTISELRVT